jgi:hypothetical protein
MAAKTENMSDSDTSPQSSMITDEEREFVHKLATPLTVAVMQVDHVLHKCAIDADVRERLNRAFVALKKIELDIAQRRAVLRGRKLNERDDDES